MVLFFSFFCEVDHFPLSLEKLMSIKERKENISTQKIFGKKNAFLPSFKKFRELSDSPFTFLVSLLIFIKRLFILSIKEINTRVEDKVKKNR